MAKEQGNISKSEIDSILMWRDNNYRKLDFIDDDRYENFRSDLVENDKAVLSKWNDFARSSREFEDYWSFRLCSEEMEKIDPSFSEHKGYFLDLAEASAVNYLLDKITSEKAAGASINDEYGDLEESYLKINAFLRDQDGISGRLEKELEISEKVVKNVSMRNLRKRESEIVAYTIGPLGAFPISRKDAGL